MSGVGNRSISIDVKLYAALLRLEGACESVVGASSYATMDDARKGLGAVLTELRRLRGEKR